jgi:hypothetical protein
MAVEKARLGGRSVESEWYDADYLIGLVFFSN